MFNKARNLQEQLVEWRRDFHSHPELGFQEVRTSGIVADTLEHLGYRVRRGVGKTGVVADLGSGKPVIALRADMDALPLRERNKVDYASQNPGVMHACGHDAHTAMGLGAAFLLSKEKFPGTVRFLFQPSEEANDAEGNSGAPLMIKDGAMQDVDMVIALHVDASVPVGGIPVQSGPFGGGVDSWFGKVLGKGGHGAGPEETVDPTYMAAHVIFALNALISRRISAFDPAVVSIGSLKGGHTENVIPDRVEITGTLRYTEEKVQKQLHAEIEKAFSLTRAMGGDYELRLEIGTPPMLNHPDAVALIEGVAVKMLGQEHILEPEKDLGGEDFGCFTKIAPGAMFMLGALLQGDERTSHSPHFDIDENCLPIGTAMLVECALRFLRRPRSMPMVFPK